MPRFLDLVLQCFTSLRLTVALLFLAMVLVFLGTLAQVKLGLYIAQEQFFRSFFVWWRPGGGDWKIPVFPAGYLLGTMLLLNLLAAHLKRFQFTKGKIGIYLIHAGLILLLVGQLLTEQLSQESSMRLVEGRASNFSENSFESELALISISDPDHDRVVAIPQSWVARKQVIRHDQLPFTLRVHRYWHNSRLQTRRADTPTPALATHGVGQTLEVVEMPHATKMDERNLPSAVVELLTAEGSLGTWLVSSHLLEPQSVTVDGKAYLLQMRLRRYYRPFRFHLLEFTHEKYRGTEIPKNFASRIRIENPQSHEDREVLIFMNNPLRYRGETFYQGSYDPNDPRVSILHCVRNPSWRAPYIAVAIVALGLTIQFLSHLIPFLRGRTA